MRLAILTLLLTGIAHAQEDPPEAYGIPSWVLIGIAKVETQSYWDDQGKFHYVDKRDGKDGEKGPFQIMPSTFREVRKRGEELSRVRSDLRLALAVTCRFLQRLYAATGSWDRAVSCYNTGLNGSPSRGAQYLLLVKLAAGIAP